MISKTRMKKDVNGKCRGQFNLLSRNLNGRSRGKVRKSLLRTVSAHELENF